MKENDFFTHLKNIDDIAQFPLAERMLLINATLTKVFGVLNGLTELSERVKENKTNITFSPDNFDKLLRILNESVTNIFIFCNSKQTSLNKYVEQAKIDSFLREGCNNKE
jgi:hypothetical protein